MMQVFMNNHKPRRKSLLCLIGVVLLSLILPAGCKKVEPIKIGVLGTMSGTNSDLSVSGRRGVELALEQINQTGGIGGKPLEMVIGDDKNDPNSALDAVEQLESSGAQIIIGPFTSGMAMAVIEDVNARDLLLLGPTISADSLSGLDDHFIRFIASTKEQANVLIKKAQREVDAQRISNMAIAYDSRNIGFTEQLVKHFVAQYEALELGTVHVIPYKPSDPGVVDSTVGALKTLQVDGLFIIAGAEDCAKMAQQLRPLIPNVQLFGPLWANTPELIKKGGVAVEGMVLVGAIDESLDPQTHLGYQEFKGKFIEHFGEEPTFASLYAYETAISMAQAMKAAGDPSPKAVAQSLINIKTFKGLQGDFSLDQYGDTTRQYLLFQIDQGKLRKVKDDE